MMKLKKNEVKCENNLIIVHYSFVPPEKWEEYFNYVKKAGKWRVEYYAMGAKVKYKNKYWGDKVWLSVFGGAEFVFNIEGEEGMGEIRGRFKAMVEVVKEVFYDYFKWVGDIEKIMGGFPKIIKI